VAVHAAELGVGVLDGHLRAGGGQQAYGRRATLPTGLAVPLSLLFVLLVGALTEFAVYRPLRNSPPLAKLVASLGVLLVAQSAMLLAFGITPQPAASILPQNTVHLLGAVIPVDRFILTGLVVAAAAGLAALYKWTRFGLATRAASENEAAAMLSGLSPSVISLINTLLASLLAGALGILAASITSLDPGTLPLQIIPALAAALLASFTSFGIACAASIGIGIMYSLIQYASAQSWFPQSGGVSLPGVTDLLAFGIIIVVLFWRGSRLPGRGELAERRLPEAPRPQHLARTGLICGLVAATALIVFPFDFREALINTLIGVLMALSLVVVTGFVGQISVVQLALAGAAGFTILHMAANFGVTFPVAALAGIAAVIAGVAGVLYAYNFGSVSASRFGAVTALSLIAFAYAGGIVARTVRARPPSWMPSPAS
jgi:branched-chain amino acid transport system permease protein